MKNFEKLKKKKKSEVLKSCLEKLKADTKHTPSVNFENLIVKMYILIISFMLAKFQEDQKSITMLSNKC